jgi:hypothetical protein
MIFTYRSKAAFEEPKYRNCCRGVGLAGIWAFQVHRAALTFAYKNVRQENMMGVNCQIYEAIDSGGPASFFLRTDAIPLG